MANRTDRVAPRWRRRLAVIASAFGLFVLSIAFAATPLAASSGHDGGGKGKDDTKTEVERHGNGEAERHGQGEAERHGNDDGAGHDANDDRGRENEPNDDRGRENEPNDDRSQDGNATGTVVLVTTAGNHR